MTSSVRVRRPAALVTSAAIGLAFLAGLCPVAGSSASASPASIDTVAAAKVKTPRTTTSSSRKAKRIAAKVASAATVSSAADFTSIFTTQQPALANSGWTDCPAAITWSVDVTRLGPAQAARQIANLKASFDAWTQASGLAFQFVGTGSFTYDEAAFTLTHADGSAPRRNIDLAFIDDDASALLGDSTVGMAGPSTVWTESKVIENATGVFRTDAVRKMTDAQARALFTHELGHALGLGHAAETANIMHPVVSGNTALGAGDVAGIRSMIKACAA